jgi:(2Fe-2S) ferredoxin
VASKSVRVTGPPDATATAPRTIHVRSPTGDGRRFDLHVFVCTTGTDCPLDGPVNEIVARFKARVRDTPGLGRIRINQAGCLDQCGHGPNLVVYPEGVWYAHVTLADVDRIFAEHIVGGRPVEDIVYKTGDRAGKNKLPRQPGEAPDRRHPNYHPCARCPWGPPLPAPADA